MNITNTQTGLNMQTVLLIALLVIASGVGGYVVGGGNPTSGENAVNQPVAMHKQVQDMTSALSGKEGDELDKAFLKEMTIHHQGAIEMAKIVLENGKRPEVKQLAEGIISAQTREIAQMEAWLQAWYGN